MTKREPRSRRVGVHPNFIAGNVRQFRMLLTEMGRESFKVRLHACSIVASLCIFVDVLGATPLPAQAAQQTSAQSAATRPVGTIKSISGNTIMLTADGGSEVGILVQDGTRLVRVAPGQK